MPLLQRKQFRPNHAGLYVPAPVAAGSGWGDHGTQIDLSTTTIANDTMTSNDNAGFSSARGATARTTADKVYFEIEILTAPVADATHIGLINADTANGAAMDGFAILSGASNYFNNGNTNTNGGGIVGTNLGSGVTTANNDIVRVWWDGPNGFQYLGQNATIFLSGDPTSGASGTGHVAAYTGAFTLYPFATAWKVVNCVLKLKTASFTYPLLSGYSAWG